MRGKLLFWDPMSSKTKRVCHVRLLTGLAQNTTGPKRQSVPIRDYSSNIKYYKLYGIKLNKFVNIYTKKSGNDKLGIFSFVIAFVKSIKENGIKNGHCK